MKTTQMPFLCTLAVSLLLLVEGSRPGCMPAAAADVVSVRQLQQAIFRRVAGPAGKGASLATGKPGSWNSRYVGSPTVVFDKGTYWMWYNGGQVTSDADFPYQVIEQIGGATSRDGIHWTPLNNGLPVLALGPSGSPDQRGLSHPYVLKIGPRFLMWYGAIDGRSGNDLGISPPHVRVEQICLASSLDGVHWKRENGGQPVMTLGAKGTVDSLQVTGMHILRIPRGEQHVFRMWYGAYNGNDRLAVAESPDGKTWKRLFDGQPIAGLRGGTQGQLGPSVHFDGQSYFLLYCGDVGNEWKTYSAVSDDGFHFRQLNEGRPVLGPPPRGNFGTAGRGANHSVHATKLIFNENRARSWYSGEDADPPHHQKIGLMEAILAP